MRLNPAAMKSCPFCGWRDITTQTRYEKQLVPCCDSCLREVEYVEPEDAPITERAIRAAVENPGLTARQIRDVLHLEEAEYRALSTALWQAVKDGRLIRGPGGRNSRTFHPGPRQWQPSMNRKKRAA